MEEAVSKQSNMQLHAFVWLWFVQHIEAKAGFEHISFANLPNDFRNSCRQNQDHLQLSSNLSECAITSAKLRGIKLQHNSMLPVSCAHEKIGEFPWISQPLGHGWEGRRGSNQLTEDWIIGLNSRTSLKDYLANHDSVATRSPRGCRIFHDIFQDKKEPRTIKKDCKNDSIPLHCPILGDWKQHCAAGKENVFLFASENGCSEDHALKSLVDTMRRCLDQFQLEN